MITQSDVIAETETRRTEDPWKPVRWTAVIGFAVALAWYSYDRGVPIGRDRVFLWVMAGLACASIGKSWRQIGYLLMDWVPFGLVLIGYDFSRGWADTAGFGVHFTPQLDADKWLFFGTVPTVWLQDHLYNVVGGRQRGPIEWYEVLFSLTYVSHYLASFVLAAVLWLKHRKRFQAYARRFVALSYMGFATYVLFPAAPPWMAADEGYLPDRVVRARSGLGAIGLHTIRDVIDKGQAVVNRVAAVPSLHGAFTVLIAITLWRSVPRWVRPVLVAYPVLMAVALTAMGEHYVSDLLLGAVYAFVAHFAWNRIERWWEGRRRPQSTVHSPSMSSTSDALT